MASDRHLKDGSVVLFVPVVELRVSTAAAAAWIAVAAPRGSIAYSVYMSPQHEIQNVSGSG